MIDKYTLTGREILLYFGRVARGARQDIEYTLAPRFPIRARTPRSKVYEYYSPQNQATTAPQSLQVTGE